MWTILHICDISFKTIQGNLIQYSPHVNLIWNWQKLSLNHPKAKRRKWHKNTSWASQYWKYFYFRSALRSLTTFWKTLITKWQDNYICVFSCLLSTSPFLPQVTLFHWQTGESWRWDDDLFSQMKMVEVMMMAIFTPNMTMMWRSGWEGKPW